MAVLELLASQPDERFTLSEVARRCELNKATAHALLSALSERGVLLRHPDDKRYSLGPRLVAIGDAARRGYTAADFVPGVLASLTRGTGLWARAWQVTADHLVCVAQTGAPAALAAVAPARLPLVPPAGAVVMAWSDPPTVEAWLARAGANEAVRTALDALPGIRRRGVSITLGSPEWRLLSEGRGPVHLLDEPAARRALLHAIARQPLLVCDLDDAAAYRAADVAAPVFASSGEVVLVLSVTAVTDDPVRGADLRALGDRVRAAADGLTAAVCGHRP